MTQFDSRKWLLSAVFAMSTGTACSDGHAGSSDATGGDSGASHAGSSSENEGGRIAATGGVSGDSGTGGVSGDTATGGATTGGTDTATGGGAGAPATLAVCSARAHAISVVLEFPEGVTAPTLATVNRGQTYDVAGTLQSVTTDSEACEACPDGQVQRLAITLVDTVGKIWSLRASPLSSAVGWQAAAKAVEGTSVSLMFRYTRGFQSVLSTGFVLRDAEGPLIVAEQAQYVSALNSGDVPGLSVSLGEALCLTQSSCAKDEYHWLVFAASTSATVDLSSDGEFVLGGRTYAARNLGAGVLKDVQCTDLERASPWTVWRRPN